MTISVFDTVEEIVGKGEMCTYKQFFLFQQYFQKAFPDPSKGVIVWEWLKYVQFACFGSSLLKSRGCNCLVHFFFLLDRRVNIGHLLPSRRC